MRRLSRGIAVVAILSLGVSGLVVAWGDAPAVLGAMAAFPPGVLIVVLALTLWNYGLRFARWQYFLGVLGVAGLSARHSLLVFLSGFAMGLTPGKSGELTKSYWLRELVGSERAPFARTAPIVFAERLVDGIAMLLLATAGLVSFQFGVLALIGVAALAALAVGLLQARPLVHRGFDMARRQRQLAAATDVIQTMYDSARELLTWPRLVVAVAVGVASWGGECVALYVIVLGLGAAPGLALLNASTFALAAGTLVGSASLLPGGIGAAEGTVAGVLDVVAGLPRDLAAAATLLIRLSTLWFGVALGAASLVLLARRVRL